VTQDRGGLGQPGQRHKVGGHSFLGATSSDAETDCSHGRPDVGVRPNVQALVVSIAYWASPLRRARTQGSRCTRPDGHPNHSITANQIKRREWMSGGSNQINRREHMPFLPSFINLTLT
jgi:hypothetical protein